MATVEIADTAVADLNSLIESHQLPEDAWRRVSELLERLPTFPQMGRRLSGGWSGYRAIGGPWRWMLIVYWYDRAANLVTVVTVQDARSSGAATAK